MLVRARLGVWVLGWVSRKATVPSLEEKTFQSKLIDLTHYPWLTFSLFSPSSRCIPLLLTPQEGSFWCFPLAACKKYKYTPWENKGVREKRQRSQLLILLLLITDSVTRYFVQQGRMFLKSVLSCQVAAITVGGPVSGFLRCPLNLNCCDTWRTIHLDQLSQAFRSSPGGDSSLKNP